MSFRQKFIENLPPNPDDALIMLADRAAAWLDAPQAPDDSLNRAYVEQILDRFIKRYRPNIQDLILTDEPSIRDYVEAIIKFAGAREVDKLLDNYERVVEEVESFGVTSLKFEEKNQLHLHIEKARKIIDESPLSDRKKNALFHRLEALRAEVDSIGTKTDRFFALAGDTAFVFGDMAEKAKPFLSEVKEILKIIRGSRARTENVQLPHEEPLGLPAPETSESEDN